MSARRTPVGEAALAGRPLCVVLRHAMVMLCTACRRCHFGEAEPPSGVH